MKVTRQTLAAVTAIALCTCLAEAASAQGWHRGGGEGGGGRGFFGGGGGRMSSGNGMGRGFFGNRNFGGNQMLGQNNQGGWRHMFNPNNGLNNQSFANNGFANNNDFVRSFSNKRRKHWLEQQQAMNQGMPMYGNSAYYPSGSYGGNPYSGYQQPYNMAGMGNDGDADDVPSYGYQQPYNMMGNAGYSANPYYGYQQPYTTPYGNGFSNTNSGSNGLLGWLHHRRNQALAGGSNHQWPSHNGTGILSNLAGTNQGASPQQGFFNRHANRSFGGNGFDGYRRHT